MAHLRSIAHCERLRGAHCSCPHYMPARRVTPPNERERAQVAALTGTCTVERLVPHPAGQIRATVQAPVELKLLAVEAMEERGEVTDEPDIPYMMRATGRDGNLITSHLRDHSYGKNR